MSHPRFNEACAVNVAMQTPPPFDFDGVTMRVLPLRAEMYCLQRFVDQYLNIIPPEDGRFRPFMPYVFLMMLNYGRMATTAANLGWLSQREICFSIPLQWYSVKDGKWVFKDFAYLCPFVYVDSELSMSTGREVYGWPKTLAWLDAETSEWMESPHKRWKMASISTMVFPEVYAGKKQEPRVLMEIEQRPNVISMSVPPDLTSPMWPWVSVPNAIVGGANLMRDYFKTLQGLGVLQQQPGGTPETFRTMAGLTARTMNWFDPSFYYNTVNLKQFRNATYPHAACYQAVTSARMEYKTINGGGPLGGPQIMMGDTSGGFVLRIHRWQSQPIIETLGLTVDEQWKGPDGVDVATLRPVMPFWLDVNMRYGKGNTLAWRSHSKEWHHGPSDSGVSERARAPIDNQPDQLPLFNTTMGAAGQAITGPFAFPNVTLRVLPMIADPERLQGLCDDYFNKPLAGNGTKQSIKLKPWGRYVYLIAINYQDMASETNDIGWWAERELGFYLPVQWLGIGGDGNETLHTLALVPVYNFANSTTAAIATTEVAGIATLKTRIDSPPSTWMEVAGPSDVARQTVLKMSSDVLPVIGEGAETTEQVLLEIQTGEPFAPSDGDNWRFVGDHWGRTLVEEMAARNRTRELHREELKKARALSLEVLARGLPINLLAFKQFRDADQPEDACYQSLVQVERVIDRIYDIREIEQPLHVRIHRYPSQPITETLGLIAKSTHDEDAGRVQTFEPVRPFWMRVAMTEKLGQTVCFRAGGHGWTVASDLDHYFVAGQPRVGVTLTHHIDTWDPKRLRAKTERWLDGKQDTQATFVALEEAKAAVQKIEPQMIIESLLSREWEHWGRASRWAEAYKGLERRVSDAAARASMADALGDQLEELQRALLERQGDARMQATYDATAEQLFVLALFLELRKHIETAYDALVAAARAPQSANVGPLVTGAGKALAMDFVPQEPELPGRAPASGPVNRFALNWSPKSPWMYPDTPQKLGYWLERSGLSSGNTTPDQKAQAVWEQFQKDPKPLGEIVQVIRSEYQRRRDWVMHQIAKLSQKPDFCFRRASVGPEADRWFPLSDCWNDDWYSGPPYGVATREPGVASPESGVGTRSR